MGPEGAAVVSPALASLAGLRELDMCGNQLRSQGALALAAALGQLTGLRSLELGSGTELGDEGASHMAGALPSMPALTNLWIFRYDDSIGEAGKMAVRAAALPSLTKLQ